MSFDFLVFVFPGYNMALGEGSWIKKILTTTERLPPGRGWKIFVNRNENKFQH